MDVVHQIKQKKRVILNSTKTNGIWKQYVKKIYSFCTCHFLVSMKGCILSGCHKFKIHFSLQQHVFIFIKYIILTIAFW